ncbi:MAG: ABC transporter ATP-binding protein [Bacillota bacterium]|nr:ABC transporter ATP-binding protein [Bacillota bacterium]MDW7678235.1 ABC transporter ATP-binding protein [Bacillota bacterium]
MSDILLEVTNLSTHFYTDEQVIPAVDGVSFRMNRGETLGIVGESGSGKSVTALSVMRLIPHPPGKIVGGSIRFKGEELLTKSDAEMRQIRGNQISMIFQEPMTSLNPVYTIGRQISEAIMLHQQVPKRQAVAKTIEMLTLVRIPLPEKRIRQYPHQLSGGMNQRVMIAMALSCMPDLLIADEPNTALDVTIQAQILEILKDLKERLGTSVLLITHDLGIIAEMATQVLVMYCGRVMEYTDVRSIFKAPAHPYTVALLKSIPQVTGPKHKLYAIKGMVAAPRLGMVGCRFKERCEDVFDRCWQEEPELMHVGQGLVRCWKYVEEHTNKEGK